MKKLICAEDIEAMVKEGQERLCVALGTILTPSAKDAAKVANLEVCPGRSECVETPCEASPYNAAPCEAEPCESAPCEDEISSELIYSALKVLQMQKPFA